MISEKVGYAQCLSYVTLGSYVAVLGATKHQFALTNISRDVHLFNRLDDKPIHICSKNCVKTTSDITSVEHPCDSSLLTEL